MKGKLLSNMAHIFINEMIKFCPQDSWINTKKRNDSGRNYGHETAWNQLRNKQISYTKIRKKMSYNGGRFRFSSPLFFRFLLLPFIPFFFFTARKIKTKKPPHFFPFFTEIVALLLPLSLWTVVCRPFVQPFWSSYLFGHLEASVLS